MSDLTPDEEAFRTRKQLTDAVAAAATDARSHCYQLEAKLAERHRLEALLAVWGKTPDERRAQMHAV